MSISQGKSLVHGHWSSQIALYGGILSIGSRDFRLFSVVSTDNSPGGHWGWFPVVITWPGSSPHDLEQTKWWFPVLEQAATNFSFSALLLFSLHGSIPRTLTEGSLVKPCVKPCEKIQEVFFLINSKRLLGAEFLYWAYGIFIIFPMRAKNIFVWFRRKKMFWTFFCGYPFIL